ncbi:MAG: ClpXP protease specificity-enhancing factor SspB [Sphingomonadaceae bacterium]|uniref:SspB family protein n=1 Tax=Thermaurantiacus sp. TaxID=2820283 RepID=UPI00298EE877|nr:ClpXP protease specificity-enhancing factor SspB [Thermaurantiacus sp.]MCS6986749.1 ClpXP protease specificity-enhancing factor SspB [Sphingomonadaceae bacterium]MDW8413988.1 ClpXP protease specificity-enhancing factor SspB [Thermaurantiacus sp.]
MTDLPEPPDPPDSLIPYDQILQDCLRGVVRRVLADVAATGLPGAHHFYIAFRTDYPGVDMPRHLHERYPQEMTIVLQHRFWDLAVYDDRFEVGLTFNQVPARLSVPWGAITGFADPAVGFRLMFSVTLPETPAPQPAPVGDDGSNVVSLDFRRRK